MPTTLSEETFREGLQFLADCDPALAQILLELGEPPMWAREPGFPTLIHIILEQQVSLASALAAYRRLLTATDPLTPDRFLEFDDATLKTIGFSRQKTAYARHLAQAILQGELDLTRLNALDDNAVRAELTKIKGIGNWTADIYLLMVLRRPDIWPKGDLALAIAVQRVLQLATRPTPEELESLSLRWRPWRAVATRLFWHFYLSRCVKNKTQAVL
jgi:DNA-3-methyladenine glycosylase II